MAKVFDVKIAYMLQNSPACDPVNGVAARALIAEGINVRRV